MSARSLKGLQEEFETAVQLVGSEQYQEARMNLQRLESAERKNSDYWSLRGFVEIQLNDVAGAEQSLLRALENNSNQFEALLNLSLIEFGRGDITAAEKYAQKAVSINSDSAYAQSVLGDVRAAQGNTDGAIGAYVSALASDPKLVAAQNNLGVLYVKRKEFLKAEQALKNAVVESNGDASVRYNLAMAHIIAGKLDSAEKQLKAVLKKTLMIRRLIYIWVMLLGHEVMLLQRRDTLSKRFLSIQNQNLL